MHDESTFALKQDGGTTSSEESVGEMSWRPPTFDKTPKISPIVHNQRKKRYHSASFSHSGTNGLTIDGVPSDIHTLSAVINRIQLNKNRLPFCKNSKKSRDGRKIPSKRGGKNHEKPTDVLDEIDLDPDDPDYDSDANAVVTFDELQPALSDEALENMFTNAMNEFFEHGKTNELIEALADVNLMAYQRKHLVYQAIMLAIQHQQTQCELTSELLSDMYGEVLNEVDVQHGFQLVLNEIGEVIIDVPKAPELIGRFIARAIADEILPPKFLSVQKSIMSQTSNFNSIPHSDGQSDTQLLGLDQTVYTSKANTVSNGSRPTTRNLSDSSNSEIATESISSSSGIGSASSLTATASRPDIALQTLSLAESFLALRHAFLRLYNIWGVTSGPAVTKILVKRIRGLLKAFINSNDISEATEALVELDAPHFHHELVYQAVLMVIELSTDLARDRIIHLFSEFCSSGILTVDQLTLGIKRIYSELSDLQLDVPRAHVLMERFVQASFKAGFMPKKLIDNIPVKHRKRFISETDSFYRTTQSTNMF